MTTAEAVRKQGAVILRGGAFKPSTSPYGFRGMGEAGLKLLAKARDEFGIAVITEVMTPSDVEMVCDYADILQIGTRNMQNYFLLDEVGKVTGTPTGVACGEGIIEWDRIVDILRGAGYKGVLSVECGTVAQARSSFAHLQSILATSTEAVAR